MFLPLSWSACIVRSLAIRRDSVIAVAEYTAPWPSAGASSCVLAPLGRLTAPIQRAREKPAGVEITTSTLHNRCRLRDFLPSLRALTFNIKHHRRLTPKSWATLPE